MSEELELTDPEMFFDPLVEILRRVPREAGPGGIGVVGMSSIEPDPATFRHQYYYNTRMNQLFMKIHREDGFAFWKQISLSSVPFKPGKRPFKPC